MLKKQGSGFSISPDEELEQKHQGSLGGQVLVERHAREAEKRAISSATSDEGSRVAMTSPPQQRPKKAIHEGASTEQSPDKQQTQSSKKHHYK